MSSRALRVEWPIVYRVRAAPIVFRALTVRWRGSPSSALGASHRGGFLCVGRPRSEPTPFALPGAVASGLSLQQILAQDHGAVVKDVVGAVEERHRAAFFVVEDGFPGIGVRGQLLPVTPAKLLPALHPMVEPLPQLGAGGHLLHPRICSDGFLLHPSWPEALHQDPAAISALGNVIRALDPKHVGIPSSDAPRFVQVHDGGLIVSGPLRSKTGSLPAGHPPT